MLQSGKPSMHLLNDQIVTSTSKVKLANFEEKFINKQLVQRLKQVESLESLNKVLNSDNSNFSIEKLICTPIPENNDSVVVSDRKDIPTPKTHATMVPLNN